MLKVRTAEAIGRPLDWLVAKAEGMIPKDYVYFPNKDFTFKPSTDWAQGGPIIEREYIDVTRKVEWEAWMDNHDT